MAEDSTNKKESVRIPCAEIVHDYTMVTLQRLGNLRCTDVYRSMKQVGGIVLPGHGKAVEDIEKLLVCVDSFIPSVPMTNEDVEKSKKFVASWKRNLLHIRKQLMGCCKPVYLQAEVARVLKERNSKVKFREVMLEWYLSRFGGDDLTPEKVADAVIAYNATDWSKVRPLAKGKKGYNIRLDVNTEKEKAVARKYVQWIYKLETDDIPATLLDDLKNDMKVIKEFEAWRDGEPKDYEYKNTYKEFCNKLRTAPVAEKPDGESDTPSVEPEVQQQVSPVTVQPSPAIEDPGEGCHLEDGYKENYNKLMAFLNNKIAAGLSLLGQYINEERNAGYIRDFARRSDFPNMYSTLVFNSQDASAISIMQFIQNVVLYNITEWGAPAPR